MRILIFLFLSFLLLPAYAEAQSEEKPAERHPLAGTWEGTITQNRGGYRANYDLEFIFRVEGDSIRGTCYISVEDIFVEMEIKGELLNDMFLKIQDVRILDSKIRSNMEWCMKEYQLIFKKKEEKIDGFWQGNTSFGPCIPGKVHLKRYTGKA